MRSSLAPRVLASVAGTAHIDLDVVDRGAGAFGQPDVQGAELHVEFDDHHRPGKPGPGQVEFDRSQSPYQRQPGGHSPFAVALQRAGPAPQFYPVGRGRDERAWAGQVADQLERLRDATEADEVKVLANNLPIASGVVLVDRNRIAVEVKQMLPKSPGTR